MSESENNPLLTQSKRKSESSVENDPHLEFLTEFDTKELEGQIKNLLNNGFKIGKGEYNVITNRSTIQTMMEPNGVYVPTFKPPTPLSEKQVTLIKSYNELHKKLFSSQKEHLEKTIIETAKTSILEKVNEVRGSTLDKQYSQLKQCFDEPPQKGSAAKYGFRTDDLANAAWNRLCCLEYVAVVRLKQKSSQPQPSPSNDDDDDDDNDNLKMELHLHLVCNSLSLRENLSKSQRSQYIPTNNV